MLLKIVWYTPEKTDGISVFSDFDNIKIESVLAEHYAKEGSDNGLVRFTNDKTNIARYIMLLRNGNLIRSLLVDTGCYYVYILNNEGKTIERIN